MCARHQGVSPPSSLKIGSLIIAIIQMIRIVLKYLEHKVKDWEKKGCSGPLIYVPKAILKCAQCVLWCFEN